MLRMPSSDSAALMAEAQSCSPWLAERARASAASRLESVSTDGVASKLRPPISLLSNLTLVELGLKASLDLD